MSPLAWVVLALVAALAVGLWLLWTAQRLDRMHHRIELARASLETQLMRRAGATLEVAGVEALDPSSRLVLLDAAHAARNAGPDELEVVESDLSVALRAVFPDEDSNAAMRADDVLGALVDELAHDCAKVELARRFHNDTVVSARTLRSRRRVRWLHLAGRASELRTVDLDDVPPPGLDPSLTRR